MKEITKNILKQQTTNILNESGLSRVWRYIQKHDIAIISAGRKYIVDCHKAESEVIDNSEPKQLTKSENDTRKKELYSILVSLGYSITKSQGVYAEDYLSDQTTENKENSFFVVNIHDDTKFKENIIRLGMYFCQDSVLFKPKKDENAVLIGTNNAQYPGFNNIVKMGKFRGGVESEFMTKIGGRPFSFIESAHHNTMTRGMMKRVAKKIITEMDIKFPR